MAAIDKPLPSTDQLQEEFRTNNTYSEALNKYFVEPDSFFKIRYDNGSNTSFRTPTNPYISLKVLSGLEKVQNEDGNKTIRGVFQEIGTVADPKSPDPRMNNKFIKNVSLSMNGGIIMAEINLFDTTFSYLENLLIRMRVITEYLKKENLTSVSYDVDKDGKLDIQEVIIKGLVQSGAIGEDNLKYISFFRNPSVDQYNELQIEGKFIEDVFFTSYRVIENLTPEDLTKIFNTLIDPRKFQEFIGSTINQSNVELDLDTNFIAYRITNYRDYLSFVKEISNIEREYVQFDSGNSKKVENQIKVDTTRVSSIFDGFNSIEIGTKVLSKENIITDFSINSLNNIKNSIETKYAFIKTTKLYFGARTSLQPVKFFKGDITGTAGQATAAPAQQDKINIFEVRMLDNEIENLRLRFGYFPSSTERTNIFDTADSIEFTRRITNDNRDKVILRSPEIAFTILNMTFEFTQTGLNVNMKCASMNSTTLSRAKIVQQYNILKGIPEAIMWDLGKSFAQASGNKIVFIPTAKMMKNENISNIDNKAYFINDNNMTLTTFLTSGPKSVDVAQASANGTGVYSLNLDNGISIPLSDDPANYAVADVPDASPFGRFAYLPETSRGVLETEGEGANQKKYLLLNFYPRINSQQSAVPIKVKVFSDIEQRVQLATPTETTLPAEIQNALNNARASVLKNVQITLGEEPKFSVEGYQVKESIQYKNLTEILNELCKNVPPLYKSKSNPRELLTQEDITDRFSGISSEQQRESIISENYSTLPYRWTTFTLKLDDATGGNVIESTATASTENQNADSGSSSSPSSNVAALAFDRREPITFVRFYYEDPSNIKQDYIRRYKFRNDPSSILKSFKVSNSTDFANFSTSISIKNERGVSQTTTIPLETNLATQESPNIDFLNNARFVPEVLEFSGYSGENTTVANRQKAFVDGIVKNMNNGIFKGSIDIIGDPFFIFDFSMNPFQYVIALDVYRNKNLTVGEKTFKERSYLSGIYSISNITHSISPSGFSTTLNVLKVNNADKEDKATE